eukprot:8056598-Prorocentrum_lima.AAC.1
MDADLGRTGSAAEHSPRREEASAPPPLVASVQIASVQMDAGAIQSLLSSMDALIPRPPTK